MSSQLKTRLTYALLKVQNNWTSESLDQVEARVSQGQHPTSPRIAIKREHSFGDDAGFDHVLRHHRTNSEPSSAHQLAQSAGGAGGRTYESFWREHEHNPITKKILQAKAASQSTHKHAMVSAARPSSRSGLQPPAQIIPDRDRRTFYNPVRQPPGLYQSYSNQSNVSGISPGPNTPPSASTPDTQRTMEQDAVESLMCLSSPGHSQRRSSQTMQSSQSQLRALAEIVVDVEEPPSSQSQQSQQSQQSSQQDAYSYGRGAITWPRSSKHARTGLGALRMLDSGVSFEDELTDEDMVEAQGEAAIGERIVEGGVAAAAS